MRVKRDGNWIIVWFIINIILTPILIICTSWAGLILTWGLLIAIVYSIFSSDKRIERRNAKKKEEHRRNWEKIRPIREKEIEIRNQAGLITNRNFKMYMHEKGFSVDGDIDIYNEIPQKVRIITHKSRKELADMGIFSVRQIFGKYHLSFDFYDCSPTTNGFTYDAILDDNGEVKRYDKNNVVVTAWFISNRKTNDSINNSDFIYYIEKEEIFVSCVDYENSVRIIDKRKMLELSEGDYFRYNEAGAIVYKYKIYRWKSGIITKTNKSSLTDNELKFIETAEMNVKKCKGRKCFDLIPSYCNNYSVYPSYMSGCACRDGLCGKKSYFLLSKDPVFFV